LYEFGKCFISHGKITNYMRLTISTLPAAHYFLMLPTKNCKRAFEFVKVIIRNIVSFFTLDTIKMAFLMTW